MQRRPAVAAVLLTLTVIAGGACGSSSGDGADRPSVVVTTPVLGDVVTEIVGDLAEVTVVMPAGASPHDFAASARQAEQMRAADVLVVNGGGLEEGLVPVIDAARSAGTDVYEAATGVDLLVIEEEEGEHAEEEGDHADEGHGHGGVDPHFFTDPARMAVAARGIADHLSENLPGIDTAALDAQADQVVADVEALDAEVEQTLAPIPQDRRLLVTDHEVLHSFADRYGLTVVGAVIPNLSNQSEPSAADLTELSATISETGAPAVFVDASAQGDVAEALARSLDGVEVVEVYAETLGPEGSGADTYEGMVRTNAERIADALG